jgi:hypothetical protein
MSEYLLSAHSFVCFADDYAIFLDLQRDKYTALEPVDARTLSTLVRGWPYAEPSSTSSLQLPLRASSETLSALLDEGLLTANETTGKSATPVTIAPATTTLAAMPGAFPKIGIGDFRRFVSAWVFATLMVRFLPLKLIVRRVRRRKERSQRIAGGFDIERAHQLMMAYFILRPNFFDDEDACLRDSLTFLEFLSRYGLYPTCVFGVKMKPSFAAHAWVQEGSVVLNQQGFDGRFVPIMTI